jgi:ankyrin repeat protein
VVRLLIEAGADPGAPLAGSWHSETPLHWAAGSDDADVAEPLTDGGANMETQDAPIGGGTPLDDAVAYRCWHMARQLAGETPGSTGCGTRQRRPGSRSLWPRTPRPHGRSQ